MAPRLALPWRGTWGRQKMQRVLSPRIRVGKEKEKKNKPSWCGSVVEH